MKTTQLKHFKQRGLTLIETMVALAIGGLVIAGALALYSSASSSNTINDMNTGISALRASTKSLFANTGSYATATNAILTSAGQVPSTFKGATFATPTGGVVTIAGTASSFTMTVTNLPQDVCVGLATAANGYISLAINANSAITTVPISVATATAQCTTGTTNQLVYTAS
jgi:prepilin-type N-terminal cleavage/methylation domain-containing protein